MQLHNLDQICDLTRGKAISQKSILNGNVPVIAAGREPTYFHNKSNREANIITISSSGAYAGYVNYFMCPIFASDCFTIKPKDEKKVCVKYLFFWLKSKQDYIYSLQSGAGQPHVYARDLARLTIHLPPIKEQKRLVRILDAVDALRTKRLQTLAQLDTLLQSTFLDMFGDPVTNPMGWKMGVIGNLLKSATYGTSKKADLTIGSYPIIRMNNITYSGGWDFNNLKYIELDANELSKYLVHKGEILFNRTNSKELVGKTAVFRNDQPMVFAGYLVKGVVNEFADPEYIGAFMNTSQTKKFLFSKCKSIVGMANINAKEFQNIPIPKPPIDLQRKFAAIVESVERQKELQRVHLAELNKLFASLQQCAFSGEL